MNCVFDVVSVRDTDNKRLLRCVKCHRELWTKGARVFAICQSHAQPGPPSLRQRFANYLTARRKWKASGKPRRTASEIAAIYPLCEACPLFQRGVCTHAKCGCNITENPKAFLNKLAWATEHCPLDKW